VVNILDQHGSGHAAAPETAAVNPVSCECSTGLDVPCAELTGITDWPDMFDLTDVNANVVDYICGYLCRNVNRFIDCADCSCSVPSEFHRSDRVIDMTMTLLAECVVATGVSE